jgi:hypothetical protein
MKCLGITRLSGGGKVATLPPGLPAERRVISYGESLNTCKSQIQQPGRLKTVDNKSKEEVNAAWHVKGIISKEEELDDALYYNRDTQTCRY